MPKGKPASNGSLRTEYVALSELLKRHHPDNPKDHDIGGIIESIQQFGFVRNVMLNEEDGLLLYGHGATSALAQMKAGGMSVPERVRPRNGEWLVPTTRGLSLDPKKAKAYVIADNAHTVAGGWDEPRLVDNLIALAQENMLGGTGFDGDDVDRLIRLHRPELLGLEEPPDPSDRIEELKAKWKTALGQLWEIGEHRIICGDCTDADAIASMMQGERATLLFSDPPYGVDIGEKNRMLNAVQPSGRRLEDLSGDVLGESDLRDLLLRAYILAREQIMADNCSYFVCAPQGGSLGLMMMMMMRDAGLPVRHVLIWVKNAPTFSLGRLDYEYQHEPILFGWKKTHKRRKSGMFLSSIWRVDKPRASPEHSTTKPVELPANAIANHTVPGDVVCDNFLGSGTTLIACEQTGRKGRGIEIDPGYVAVSLERLSALGLEPQLVKRTH